MGENPYPYHSRVPDKEASNDCDIGCARHGEIVEQSADQFFSLVAKQFAK
jgi:hypothetical protein